MAKNKFYVVWEGASRGVFKTWEECQDAVKGHPGAKYKSFSSEEEAEDAFYAGPDAFVQQTTNHSENKQDEEKNDETEDTKQVIPTAKKNEYRLPEEVIRQGVEAIAVDAACSGNPGPMEYRGVYLATGTEIFHFGPVHGTNNIGEFLAIVHGLALMKQKGLHNMPLYSDSINAQLWVRKQKCKTTLKRDEKTEELYKMIERAEKWLKENTYSNPIMKWQTDKWGEIPADFGRK